MQIRLGEPAGDVQRPERAQLARVVGLVLQHALQPRVDGRVRTTLLQHAARVLDVPVVAVQLQLDQLGRGQLRRDRRCTGRSFWLLILKMRPRVF